MHVGIDDQNAFPGLSVGNGEIEGEEGFAFPRDGTGYRNDASLAPRLGEAQAGAQGAKRFRPLPTGILSGHEVGLCSINVRNEAKNRDS